jgi:hypothetical protein
MRHWDLPPLVLHPFSQGVNRAAVFEDQGVEAWDNPRRSLMQAKYCEFRMLCFVGKDLMRWVRQCADFASRDALLLQAAITERSFADLLVNRTPPNIAVRFREWGVQEYSNILARSIGLNAIFPGPPEYKVLTDEFLEDLSAYADSLYLRYQNLRPFPRLEPEQFTLSMYTSDEYVQTLEGALKELGDA